MKIKIISLALVILTLSPSIAKEYSHVFLWDKAQKIVDKNNVNNPCFNLKNGNLDYDHYFIPNSNNIIKIKNNTSKIEITDISFETSPLSEEEKNIHIPFDYLKNEPTIKANIVKINHQQFASIRICGLMLQNNQIVKINSIKYSIIETYANSTNLKTDKISINPKTLSIGNWHKFAITNTGVHSFTFEELKKLNVIQQATPSEQIKIFGNEGKMLPYLINQERHGQLSEISIEVLDGGDGYFNESDTILFYAEKGSNIEFDKSIQNFKFNNNHYSDTNFVFITINNESPLRISTLDNSSMTEVASFTTGDFIFHQEQDSLNFIKSGRIWVGENIHDQNPKEFKIPIYHKKDESINLFVNLCSRSLSSENNNISIVNNTDTIGTLNFPNVSSVYYNDFVKFNNSNYLFNSNSDTLNLKFYFHSKENGALAYNDYFTLIFKKKLDFNSKDQLFIKNKDAFINTDIYQYTFSSTSSNFKIWDITDYNAVLNMSSQKNGNEYSFKANSFNHNEFVVFNHNNLLKADYVKKIDNQSLSFNVTPEYLIISHPDFLSEAIRLAEFHQNKDGLKASVVNVEHIYNQFSSGRKEAIAIRDYVRQIYNYPQNGDTLKYLLLMGNGSFDPKNRVNNNKDFIPTYQSENSIKLTASYASDDFYAVLDSSEGDFINDDQLDISVGRLPVKTLTQAKSSVDKIMQYYDNFSTKQNNGDVFSTKDSWRNKILFVADDGDNNTHMDQAEKISEMIDTTIQNLNISKIYIDAFPKENLPSGATCNAAKKSLSDQINQGALIVNYTGHGGEYGWSSERIFEINDIYKLENKSRLPLVITATCEFSRFDDPSRVSAGEFLFLEPEAGAIALFTTTRLVFSIPNFTLNRSFYEILNQLQDNNDVRIGDLFLKTKLKNNAGTNDRNFTLLGDPAIKLNMPQNKIMIDSISINNNKIDSLSALTKAKIIGHLETHNNQKLNNFNGKIEIKIFDKKILQSTLDNESKGITFKYNTQTSLLFKGNFSVKNGNFIADVIIPKNILLSYGNCKISLYAYDENTDAKGFSKKYILGGSDSNAINDTEGPKINIFVHDTTFSFGGIVPPQPYFIAKLDDASGINLIPENIGKNLVLTLNKSPETEYVLNNYYQTVMDSYQNGEIQFQLKDFKTGSHTIEFSASDNYNNTSKAYTEFIIEENAEIALQHLLNYPNPFTSNTGFYFEHNQNSGTIEVSIQIYTITGKIIKTINTSLNINNKRLGPIEWNGLDDFNDPIGKGVYIYKLKVETEDGKNAEMIEKLVILK